MNTLPRIIIVLCCFIVTPNAFAACKKITEGRAMTISGTIIAERRHHEPGLMYGLRVDTVYCHPQAGTNERILGFHTDKSIYEGRVGSHITLSGKIVCVDPDPGSCYIME